MNGITMVLIALFVLLLGYRFYATYLAELWGVDKNAKTPAVEFKDNPEFSATSKWMAFSHQFTSITGAGPVTGPIIAAMFGWLPAMLWLLLGSIFFGAVHDFSALYASVKSKGKSIGMIIEEHIGYRGKQLFLIFSWLLTVLVIAAFADIVANTFNGFSPKGAKLVPGAAAASISMIYMVGAVLFGFYLKYRKPNPVEQLGVGIVFMVVMVWLGIVYPIFATTTTWRLVTFAYIFVAATVPLWILKQPRDYLSMFLLLGMIVGGVIGVFVKNPTIQLPAFVGFEVNGLSLFPMLFVTIACGSISGFHSMVSAGTTSKMISNETDMKFVGYGSMVTETMLAIVALIIVGAAATGGVMPKGTPFQLFSLTLGGFLTDIFGLPANVAACIMTMCVSALALTTVDACARISRLCLQELFTPRAGEAKSAFQQVITNPIVATVVSLALAYVLCLAGYMSVWPLFGSANQLLATLVLVGVAVFLKATGRKGWMLYGPIAVMFCVCITAIGMTLWSVICRFSAGTFNPMVHGLQLVIGAALIYLACLVVWHGYQKIKS